MSKFLAIIVIISLSACAVPEPIMHYRPANRQLPPEKVYSRVMWSHLPQPFPTKPSNNTPLIMPVVSFELPNSTIEEAVEALAQTIGYNWHYPAEIARRPVSINMVGTVEEILSEIGKQAGVGTVLDHERRLVSVVSNDMLPTLPGY